MCSKFLWFHQSSFYDLINTTSSHKHCGPPFLRMWPIDRMWTTFWIGFNGKTENYENRVWAFFDVRMNSFEFLWVIGGKKKRDLQFLYFFDLRKPETFDFWYFFLLNSVQIVVCIWGSEVDDDDLFFIPLSDLIFLWEVPRLPPFDWAFFSQNSSNALKVLQITLIVWYHHFREFWISLNHFVSFWIFFHCRACVKSEKTSRPKNIQSSRVWCVQTQEFRNN